MPGTERRRMAKLRAKTAWEYWVVAMDGHKDADVPFPAVDKAHAEAWISQPFAQGRYKMVRRRVKRCHTCGRMMESA